MSYLSRPDVVKIVSEAIAKRTVLKVRYDHTDGSKTIDHTIAPFDIGSTNPKTAARFADALWAYSYTHTDDKTGRPDPKVCRFDVNHFVRIETTNERFDEIELTVANEKATRYDYRTCKFALLPSRNWYGR